MKLVIIADDNRIGVDGFSYGEFDLSALDPTIHAVQWYDTYGEVEFKPVFADGKIHKPANQIITSIDSYSWAVTAFNAKKSKEDALIAEQEAIAAQSQPTTTGTQTL